MNGETTNLPMRLKRIKIGERVNKKGKWLTTQGDRVLVENIFINKRGGEY